MNFVKLKKSSKNIKNLRFQYQSVRYTPRWKLSFSSKIIGNSKKSTENSDSWVRPLAQANSSRNSIQDLSESANEAHWPQRLRKNLYSVCKHHPVCQKSRLNAGGKPSTWFTPGGPVELCSTSTSTSKENWKSNTGRKKTELPETRKKSTENLKKLRFQYQSVR